MNRFRYVVVFILLVTTILIGNVYMNYSNENYLARNGVFDLSETDFYEKKIIQLKGQWEFYGNQFVSPQDITNKKLEPVYIHAPGNWNNVGGGHKESQYAYGTYRLMITNIPKQTYYGIIKNQIRNACKVYINGELIMEDGIPAKTMEKHQHGNILQMASCKIDGSSAEIIIHVSNYDHFSGGIIMPIYFGEQKVLVKEYIIRLFQEFFCLAILFIVGIIYLAFYILHKSLSEEASVSVFLSINCFSLGVHYALRSERFLLIIFPNLPMEINFKIIYIGAYVCILTTFFIINKIDKTFLPDKIKHIASLVNGVFILVILLTQQRFYDTVSNILLVLSSIVLFAVMIWILFLYIKGKHNKCGYEIHTILLFTLYSGNIYIVNSSLSRFGSGKHALLSFGSILAYVIFLILLFLCFYYEIYKENREMAVRLSKAYNHLEQTSEEARKKEIAFLQAQIKPHFLFNTLSVISSMITRKPTESKKMILNLSNYLRNNFDFDVNEELVPLKDEVNLVHLYIEIEKARFGKRMEFILDCSEIPASHIPRLTIQPLVENALRHGILKRSQGGKVILEIKENGDSVVIRVIDNGIGISQGKIHMLLDDSSEVSGVGIKNINKRLTTCFGKGLMIFSEPNIETCVMIEIPVTRGRKND